MIEVRIHGRGGQGAVDMALLIAHAGRHRGWQACVWPEVEAGMRLSSDVAWVRLDGQQVDRSTPVVRPTHVVVLRAALVPAVPVSAGLGSDATLLLDAAAPASGDLVDGPWTLSWVDATGIARDLGLGTPGAFQAEAPLLGAYAALSGVLTADEVVDVMDAVFPSAADRHARAALAGFRTVRLLPGPGQAGFSRGPQDGP